MIKILFVDDDQNLLDGLKRGFYFDSKNWYTAYVNSGLNALDKLSKEPFDIVVTDVRMPEMNGVELLLKIRELYPNIVRIILSGFSDKETYKNALNVAHHYMSKPCKLEDLKSLFKKISTT